MAHARQHCNAPMQHTQSTRNERQNELLQPNAQTGEATAQRLPQAGFRKLRAVFRSGAPGRWGGCLGQAINDLDQLGLGHLRRANRVGGQESSPLGKADANSTGFVELTWSKPTAAGLARFLTSDLQLISGQAVSTDRTHGCFESAHRWCCAVRVDVSAPECRGSIGETSGRACGAG